MNPKPKFYVRRIERTTGLAVVLARSPIPDEGPFADAGAASNWAASHSAGFKTVTVLRDSCGSDHPENAGKRFLHQIIK